MAKFSTSAVIDLRSSPDKTVKNRIKGRKYNTSLSDKRKGRLSRGQRRQQAKAELAAKIIHPLKGLFKVTFLDKPHNDLDFKDPTSHILAHVIPNPDLRIHWSALFVSLGEDPLIEECYAKAAPGKIVFFWEVEDDRVFRDRPDSDLPVLVAYEPGLFEAVYMIGGATYADGMAVLNVKEFRGQKVHVYLGFATAKMKMRTDSVYLGKISIP